MMTDKISIFDDTIELRYNLHDLPTAQHKAGLAGLILLIHSLRERKKEPLPTIIECSSGAVRLSFTLGSMQTVFDDWFRAARVEIKSKSKWSGKKEPLRTETVAVKGDEQKLVKVFVYEQILPALEFLTSYYQDQEGGWTKLWRDALWGTLRGIPKTRGVYEETIGGKTCSVAQKQFDLLAKAAKAWEKGVVYTDGIASSVFIGAQDVNAEKVPFVGALTDNFLLHFWPLGSLVFAPRTVTIKGELDDAGFVFAIPEVSDLDLFLDDFRDSVRSLEPRVVGYRPTDSLIDLPDEGGLEYLHSLATGRIGSTYREVTFSVDGVEVYHIQKRGNSICTMYRSVIEFNPGLMNEYDEFRKSSLNPFYKALRIRNLLARNQEWYEGALDIFTNWPAEFFIWKPGQGGSPHRIPFFGLDVRRKFAAIRETAKQTGGNPMNEKDQDDRLALCVHRMVQAYLWRRTEERSGITYDSFKDRKTDGADGKERTDYPPKYVEALEKVALDTFLAMRGRKAQDFVEYFAGTICSVPQFLPETQFLMVSTALLTDSERVKTLAMLAVSANSRI